MSMFNDNIKMTKDFYWKIKPSIETTLFVVVEKLTLYLEVYNVELIFYDGDTMLNQLFSTSYQKKSDVDMMSNWFEIVLSHSLLYIINSIIFEK